MLGQSSQLAEPLLTDSGISGISVHKLVSTEEKKEKKSTGGEWIVEHFSKILASEEKVTIITNQRVGFIEGRTIRVADCVLKLSIP